MGFGTHCSLLTLGGNTLLANEQTYPEAHEVGKRKHPAERRVMIAGPAEELVLHRTTHSASWPSNQPTSAASYNPCPSIVAVMTYILLMEYVTMVA